MVAAMRVRIIQTVQLGSQTLNAGVECELPQALAEDWVADGIAQAQPEAAPAAEVQAQPEAAPAKPSRKKG